jgi:phage gp16-like protein
MQPNEKSNRQKVIAQIHIAKKQLGLDNDVYSCLLDHETSKASCSDMSLAELYRVLHVMKQKGFKPKRKSSSKSRRLSPPSGTTKVEEIDKIRAIWITMFNQNFVRDGSEAALDAYVKRMTAKHNKGLGVESVAWLEGKIVIVVIESLKNWHKRELIGALKNAGVVVAKTSAYDFVCEYYKEKVAEGIL